MKRFIGLLCLLLAPAAWATTTVTGKIQTLGTGNVTSGAFVRFWLRGCAGNQPRVNGTSVIGPTQGGVFFFDIAADASGNTSGTVYSTRDNAGTGNGDIECGGSKQAVWYGMQIFVAGKGGPEIPIHAKSGATMDITQVTPITTNPVITSPTGDSTYLRLDAGNGPVTGNLQVTGTTTLSNGGTLNGTFAGNPTLCRLGNIRYVDAANVGSCWSGSDHGAWVMSAIADLPTVTINGSSYSIGKIVLGPASGLSVTQSTTVTVGPLVLVSGPGSQQLTLNCTMNADCWAVRDSPFNNIRASYVGGFTLLGQGTSNANANGMHIGDLNSAHLLDITIDNFRGANSSCFWADNQNGWMERNHFDLEIGAHMTSAGEIENGCTKGIRFTTSVNAASISFGYDRWDVRMSVKVSGQIGWSVEPTNPINLYNCWITGNANMVAGAILFQISPATNGAGTGCLVDLKVESSGAATGWSTAASPPTPFTYYGPGIVRNGGSTAVTDSVGANSLVNLSGTSQTASVTGCTTGAVQFNTCDVTLTWPLPFADTNYQVVCNGDGFTGVVGVLQGADMNGLKLTTSVNVRTVTLNASAFTFTKITCTATRQGL